MPWKKSTQSLYGFDTENFESERADSRIKMVTFNTHKKNKTLTVVVKFSTDELAKQQRGLFIDLGFQPKDILVSGSAITLQNMEASKVAILNQLKSVESDVSEIIAMLDPIGNPDANRVFSGSTGSAPSEEKPFQPH